MRLLIIFLFLNLICATLAFGYSFLMVPSGTNQDLISELISIDHKITNKSNFREITLQLQAADKEKVLNPTLFQSLDQKNVDLKTIHSLIGDEINRLSAVNRQSWLEKQDNFKWLGIGVGIFSMVNAVVFGTALFSVRRIHRDQLLLESALEAHRVELSTTRDLAKRKARGIVQLRREHQNLREQFLATLREAELDPKGTGALTAKAGMNLFSKAISQNLGRIPIWGLIVDADKFKSVNDTYGHKAGDIVLETLVGCLQGELREADFIYRFGGEEFVVVLIGGNPQEAFAIAERLRTKVAQTPIWIGDRDINITFSAGLAECSEAKLYPEAIEAIRNRSYQELDEENSDQKVFEELAKETLEVADAFLYKAKHSGRNRVISALQMNSSNAAIA